VNVQIHYVITYQHPRPVQQGELARWWGCLSSCKLSGLTEFLECKVAGWKDLHVHSSRGWNMVSKGDWYDLCWFCFKIPFS